MKKTRETSSQASEKRIPQRTCVSCRQVKDKRELVRLVRTSGGTVEVDTKGKTAGRGAYLCRSQQCWETGLQGGRLEHTLKVKISQDDRKRLDESGKALFVM